MKLKNAEDSLLYLKGTDRFYGDAINAHLTDRKLFRDSGPAMLATRIEALATVLYDHLNPERDETEEPEPVVPAPQKLDRSCEYLEAAVWMGTKGHEPYLKYGTGNVIKKAYELGWEGPRVF